MVADKKVVVIMPAYNAGQTLRKTFNEIPFEVVDEVILTDDRSTDDTVFSSADFIIQSVFQLTRNGTRLQCKQTLNKLTYSDF